ncbi:MAG: class I SAM-dependent methyltransferase [Burkholderiaceae bacterium]
MSEVPAAVRSSRRELPSPWVVRFAPLIAAGGSVLDVASGTGRHARWLAARGHRVTAVDRDADALDACGASETIRCDLEMDGQSWSLGQRAFAAVVVTNYLHRPLFPALIAALAPGGVLLYETFAVGNERFGRPRNPAFLLRPGELLQHCASLDIVAYEDGLITDPGPASIQRICAVSTPLDGPRHAL